MIEKGVSPVTENLARLVEKFLTANPECKLKSIALEAGVGVTTIYRLMRREQAPSADTARRLLGVISSPELAADFMGDNFRDQEYFKENKEIMQQREYSNPSIKAITGNIDTHRLYALGLRKQGITRQEALRFGEETLESLLNSGAMREINGKIKSVCAQFSKDDDIVSAIKLAIESQEIREFQKPSARIYEVDGISYDGIGEMRKLLLNFWKNYNKIKQDFKGDRACEMGLVFGEIK